MLIVVLTLLRYQHSAGSASYLNLGYIRVEEDPLQNEEEVANITVAVGIDFMIEAGHMTGAEVTVRIITTMKLEIVLEMLGIETNITEITEGSLRKETGHMTGRTRNEDDRRPRRSRGESGSRNRGRSSSRNRK